MKFGNEKAETPLNKEFVASYSQVKHSNELPAEDAADAFAAAQILQKAVEEVGKIDPQAKPWVEWLHANKVETILGDHRPGISAALR